MTQTLTDAEACDLVRKHSWFATNASDGYVLVHWPDYVAAARAAYTLALSRTVDREREAASKALIECASWLNSGVGQDKLYGVEVEKFHDRHLARTYPVTPEPVVLSDGSTVTLSDSKHYFVVRGLNAPPRTWRVDQWRHIATTGADFDKLKALAATLTEPSHD
jgi:hypothetical protein